MDNFTKSVAEQVYAKKDTSQTRSKKREEMLQKRRFKNMPIEKKVEVIKARYGLSHGGSKQNKRKRKKKG